LGVLQSGRAEPDSYRSQKGQTKGIELLTSATVLEVDREGRGPACGWSRRLER
jgi:hypothetical protein